MRIYSWAIKFTRVENKKVESLSREIKRFLNLEILDKSAIQSIEILHPFSWLPTMFLPLKFFLRCVLPLQLALHCRSCFTFELFWTRKLLESSSRISCAAFSSSICFIWKKYWNLNRKQGHGNSLNCHSKPFFEIQ